MSHTSLARLTPATVLSFIGTWVFALVAASMVPVLITAMIVQLQFSVAAAGGVATAMTLASVIAMGATGRVVHRFSRPRIARTGLGVMALGFGFAAAFSPTPALVATGIIVGGVGVGLVVGAAIAASAVTENPDRTTTVVMVVNRAVAAAILLATPIFQNDIRVLLAALACIALLGMFCARGLPNLPGEAHERGAVLARPRNLAVGLVVAVLAFAWSATEDMVYAMALLLGESAGIAPDAAGLLLALQVSGGILGGLLAPTLIRWLGRGWALVAVVLVSTVGKFLLVTTETPAVYAVSIVAWGITYGAALVLILGLAAKLDVTGRIGVFVSTGQLLGVAVGPVAGGILFESVPPLVFGLVVAIPSLIAGGWLFAISRRSRELDRYADRSFTTAVATVVEGPELTASATLPHHTTHTEEPR